MCTKFCKNCETELGENDEAFPLEEFGNDYICSECHEDLKKECPNCFGRGCNYCLMCDY